MSRYELLALLRGLAKVSDYERSHGEADDALIAYINDPEIAEAYESLTRWYA